MTRYNSTMATKDHAQTPEHPSDSGDAESSPSTPEPQSSPREIGGRKKGLDPTRYGDWEKNGRCIDF